MSKHPLTVMCGPTSSSYSEIRSTSRRYGHLSGIVLWIANPSEASTRRDLNRAARPFLATRHFSATSWDTLPHSRGTTSISEGSASASRSRAIMWITLFSCTVKSSVALCHEHHPESTKARCLIRLPPIIPIELRDSKRNTPFFCSSPTRWSHGQVTNYFCWNRRSYF